MDEFNQEKKRKSAVFPAIILIILGAVFLMANFSSKWSWDFWWPVFVLVPGLAFYFWYFSSSNKTKISGILLPGTILTLFGIFFFITTWLNWQHMDSLWPTFILVPGLAFFVFYFAQPEREKGILIPAFILTGLAIVFYLSFGLSNKLWPLILIALGLILLIIPRKKIN
jgi:uncharacterized membrane protein HdeD (DUF308 family)